MFYTIPQGQRVAVWNMRGERTLLDGPRRLFLFRQRVVPLKPFAAEPTQYLIIKFKDGRTVHERGPAVAWQDPVEHESIEVADAISLDANEALVVYKQDGEAGAAITRRIVRGPELFVPTPTEWMHTFSWHGATVANPTKKVPSALRFTKLRVIPDQMYFDVEDVRTVDDALIIVRLMIFFELGDIGTMLNETHDPVADFINAVTADTIDFASRLTFEQLKEHTEKLSNLETYGQLTARADRIGYHISKVVYRGYAASPKLQAMHDNAIETRTRLRLESETELQVQALADLKLTREQDRARQKQEMEQAEARHALALKQAAHDATLRQVQAEQDQKLTSLRKSNDETLRHESAKQQARLETQRTENTLTLQREQDHNGQRTALLQSMAGLGVDLTRYLVSKHQHPDRTIRLEGPAAAATRVHLHEPN